MTARTFRIVAGAALAASLAGCVGPGAGRGGPRLAAAAPPRPAEGLWAILDPGCRKPHQTDTRTWPLCASPFWISRDSAVVVKSKPTAELAGAQASYRASYRLAAGVPLIAQVGNAKDGYLFLALTQLDRDPDGRLVAATGAAFACRPDGATAAPTRGGCEGQSQQVLRRAAARTLEDPSSLTRVAWIAPGAPAAP